MRFILSLIACWFVVSVASAQMETPDSTAVTVTDTMHSVKKAVIFSAVLPGAGQVYNHLAMPKGQKKAFWKVPLIYAGLGAAGYFLVQNNTLKKDLRAEYDSRQDGNVPSEQFQQYDDAGILQLYAIHRTRRDLSILALGVVYILNVVDAGVEAHFVHFDVSDNLSMSFHPVLMPNYSPGLGLRLNFH
jgi:hypothetical protein